MHNLKAGSQWKLTLPKRRLVLDNMTVQMQVVVQEILPAFIVESVAIWLVIVLPKGLMLRVIISSFRGVMCSVDVVVDVVTGKDVAFSSMP